MQLVYIFEVVYKSVDVLVHSVSIYANDSDVSKCFVIVFRFKEVNINCL